MWCSPGLNTWVTSVFLNVNDMKAVVKCKLILYADDSALLVSGKNVVKIEQVLNGELK